VRAAIAGGLEAAADVRVALGSPPADVWESIVRVAGTNEQDLADRAARSLHVPVADLEARSETSARLVPAPLARAHHIVPLRDSDRDLVVATADPMNFEAEQALSFASGRTVRFELAGPSAIERALRITYPAEEGIDDLLSRIDDSVADAVRVVEELTPEAVAGRETHTAPIVKLSSMILSEAIRQNASDIHIEPAATLGTVRLRVDGVLQPFMQMPLGAMTRVVSRFKVLADMDIADRVRPQDGRARIAVAQKEYDLRISTVPASGSEKAVIRVLYPKTADRLEQLQLPAGETAQLRRLLAHRDGIVVVTGPTGSGKTTTLYAALRELATGRVNITTVEDPVEYELDGVTQIQVDPKRGVTFASALRAILRQDPDIVLVGEIRDQETASVALRASLTGHLVLATLHTNDAPTAVTRMLDLDLDAKNLAAALRGVVAQRLIRRVCTECARPVSQPGAEEQRLAERYGTQPTVRAIGCERCGGTGYRGRIAAIEVLTADAAIETAIGRGASAQEIRELGEAAGMRPLVEHGLDHVRAGITTLQEVERVLGDPDRHAPKTIQDARPHVLVVDDDEVVREITAAALTEADLRVTQASDGVEALEHIREGAFELVLLDLDMPRLDGMATLARIRQNLATGALPVIVQTANREAEIRVMEAGADDYLAKPVDPSRLVARVRAVLRRRGL
jgi:type II secretory ATPase GspE/PulE/Tfp pilus assembly ATPase PilB-like protein